jgi:hypothetical protein
MDALRHVAGGDPARAAGTQQPPAPELAASSPKPRKPTEDAPWHDPRDALPERMELAKAGSLKDKLFAAMAQTDYRLRLGLRGYAALASGETTDTLCVR